MDQGQAAVDGLGRCRCRRWSAGTQRQTGDQVERAALPAGRIGEDLLFQPIDPREFEAVGPGGEERLEEFGAERYPRRFEPLVMVSHGTPLCRCPRPVLRPRCGGEE